MNKKILITAAILGAIAVVLGAFGAHGLKEQLAADSLESYKTGVHYQMMHALFLGFLSTTNLISIKAKKIVWLLVIFGVLLFSGSIFLLSTKAVHGIDFSGIGFVTPIGGLLLILSWFLLGLYAFKFDEK